MSTSEPNETIAMIPISRIRVLNPRVRDKRRFAEIVRNIKVIGLKRPITLRLDPDSPKDEPTYEVVCGQGRLEAFIALGQTHIPAIVRECDRKEALLASLVENIARRRIRGVEQIQSIYWMKQNGNDAASIARMTGLGEAYVKGILRLLENGETRLLDAVLHGRMPVTIAIQIAMASDDEAQRILMEAYDRGELKQKSLGDARRVLNHRRTLGKTYGRIGERRKRTTAEAFLSGYRQLAARQKLMVKKARTCEARLLALTAAFQALTADEHFLNLLRAEKLGTMPKFLAERIRRAS
jgi:ParB family chromosome partitioning protein